jgi:sigma-54 specific flagellar transcriptional regulator A
MTQQWTPRTADSLPVSRSARNEGMGGDAGTVSARFGGIDTFLIGTSPAMRGLKDLIALVGPSDAPVMVRGETGTGKELVAEALHVASGRSGALVAVNCAAIPADLLESELFGHEKGAFTGAERRRIGYVEQAAGGTLFLDEIGDMPLALQSKLLRVLEARQVQRLGGSETLSVDFRLVTATHQSLEARVREGKFREDLFHRINTFPLTVPRLAERAQDIGAILEHMMDQRLRRDPRARLPQFDQAALRFLECQPWTGNVRELRSVFDRACVLFAGRTVGAAQVEHNLLTFAVPSDRYAQGAEDAGEMAGTGASAGLDPLPHLQGVDLSGDAKINLRTYLRDIEVEMIERALLAQDGCVSQTARVLGLQRTTLIEKMKKLCIRKPGA